MENTLLIERTEINKNLVKISFDEKLFEARPKTNPILETIFSEGGEDFHQYINWIGLSKEPNLMVLSSMHHYYYDHNDMKGIKALVNIKKLNQIRHLESFLHILFRILNSNAYFIGCFKSTNQGTGSFMQNQPGKLFNGLINIIDSRTDRYMTKKGVLKLLEEHGFKVIDMSEIRGNTYFWAQNVRRNSE
jgi:hypothetical protein